MIGKVDEDDSFVSFQKCNVNTFFSPIIPSGDEILFSSVMDVYVPKCSKAAPKDLFKDKWLFRSESRN